MHPMYSHSPNNMHPTYSHNQIKVLFELVTESLSTGL